MSNSTHTHTHQDRPHTSCHTFASCDNAKVLGEKKKYGVANANPMTSELRQNAASFCKWNQSSYISAPNNRATRPYILEQINICRLTTWAGDTWTTLSYRIKHLILWWSFISPHDTWHDIIFVMWGEERILIMYKPVSHGWQQHLLSESPFVESQLLPSVAPPGTNPSLYSR